MIWVSTSRRKCVNPSRTLAAVKVLGETQAALEGGGGRHPQAEAAGKVQTDGHVPIRADPVGCVILLRSSES